MTFLQSLFHPQLIFSLGLFGIVSILVELAAYKILLTAADVPPSHWIATHIIIPAARTLALVCFILTSYPVLFGVASAPAITELLAAEQLRLSNLVNVVFLLSLLLPLIPVFNRWPAIILPLQGIAAATMVFHWWVETQAQLAISYWPDTSTVLSLLIMSMITHELSRQLSSWLGKPLDRVIQREGSEALIYRTAIMFMQVPAILLYTLTLGRQLH